VFLSQTGVEGADESHQALAQELLGPVVAVLLTLPKQMGPQLFEQSSRGLARLTRGWGLALHKGLDQQLHQLEHL